MPRSARATCFPLLFLLLLAALAVPVRADDRAAAGPEPKKARENLLSTLLQAGRESEAAEVLRSYRSAGATEGNVQFLLCHAGQILSAYQRTEKIDVNSRLLALDPEAALLVGDKVQRPQVLEHTPPQYTEEARAARLQGTVILQAVVGADGRVNDAEVLKGLPMGLAGNAVDAVKQWTFAPATLEGTPVPSCYALTVTFQLQPDEGKIEPK
jgi:TonB family protein